MFRKYKFVKVLLSVLLLSVSSFGSCPCACPTSCQTPTPTPIEDGLSDAQLHAVMGIITNFLLSEDVPKPDTVAPVFTSQASVTVAENQTSAITVVASDASGAVTYALVGGDSADFSIDSSTGVIRFNTAPDFETRDTYSFTVTATDSAGNVSSQSVTIHIANVPEDIVHNGTTYGTVTSPYTGKVWLDRNLGAAQVCTSFDDVACYGDYYQWGRNFDGHQDSLSSTTRVKATDVNSAGGSFIIITLNDPYGNVDWALVDQSGDMRIANWSKTDGTSVCPVGFRVPTLSELRAELLDLGSAQIQNRDDAFSGFLKFPSAGNRQNLDGSMFGVGLFGEVWSSTIDINFSRYLGFGSGDASASWDIESRDYGKSVRCLRD